MRRGWRIASGAAVLAVAAGFAGLLHFRERIVERMAARELAARGLGEAAFRVEGVGLRSARVVEIELAPEIAARSVTLRYAILPPRLDRVIVEGLRLDLSRPDEGALAMLRDSLGGEGEAGALPLLEFGAARIEAVTPLGRFGLAFDGTLIEGAIELDGSLELGGRPLATVAARGRPEAFEASLAEADGLTITAKGALGARVEVDAAAEVGGASALLATLGVAAPPGRYRLRAAGSLEAFSGVADAQVDTALGRIAAAVPFEARRVDGEARAESNGVGPLLKLERALVEAETPNGRFGLVFDATWAANRVELDGSLEHAGGALAVVSARGRPEAFEASIMEVGGLTLTAKGGAGDRMNVDAVAEIGRSSALLDALGLAAPPGLYRLRADGTLDGVAGAADAQVETPFARITIAAPFEARRVDGGARVSLNGAEIAAPQRGLRASGVSGAIELVDAPTAKLTVAKAETPWTAPAALTVAGSLKGGAAQFAGSASVGGLRLSARGRHVLATGKGSLAVDLPRTELGPTRQPGAALPALAALAVSSGAVAASAELRWSGAALDGAASLDLDALTFEMEGIEVEALAGRVRFSGLLPPETPPGQALRAERIGAGADLADVRLRFALDGAAGALAIERFDAGFAGGRLIVAGARISAAARNAATLQVHDVSLADLLPLLGLDGLGGEGRLSGLLPIAVQDGKVAVEGGELAAASRGVLRFRSPRAREALAAGGDYVALALDALEDFRYDRLSLAVDKALEGTASIKLSTLGSNPGVLDGHPFAININLTGDADNLVQAALAALRLSDRALGAIVRGR